MLFQEASSEEEIKKDLSRKGQERELSKQSIL
jgi:hypothetical protein